MSVDVSGLKEVAVRLTTEFDRALHYLNVVRMSKSPAQEREYIMKVGALADRTARDVEQALKRPPNGG